MSRRYSEGARNALLGKPATVTSDTISFTASNTIAITEYSLLDVGFRPGDPLIVSGTVSNNGIIRLASIGSDGLSATTTDAVATEAAGSDFTLTGYGKSFSEIFKYGIFVGYAGTMPSDADDAPGTALIVFTMSGGSFTRGTSTNGLTFSDAAVDTDDSDKSKMEVASATSLQGDGISDGTISYLCLYDNAYNTAAATSSVKPIRIYMDVSTSTGADVGVVTQTVVSGVTNSMSSAYFRLADR